MEHEKGVKKVEEGSVKGRLHARWPSLLHKRAKRTRTRKKETKQSRPKPKSKFQVPIDAGWCEGDRKKEMKARSG